MEQISTNHSLLNAAQNDVNEELDELKILLTEKKEDYQEVFNYLDGMIKDVNEDTVHKVLKFAKQYCRQAKDKENTEIR